MRVVIVAEFDVYHDDTHETVEQMMDTYTEQMRLSRRLQGWSIQYENPK